jgi:uncharacterized membrane protein
MLRRANCVAMKALIKSSKSAEASHRESTMANGQFSWRRHFLLLSFAGTWCAAIVGFPWLVRSGWIEPAFWIALFFSKICHQIPARSFHWAGVALPVCARCTTIYVAGLAGALQYPGLKYLGNTRAAMPRILTVALFLLALDVGAAAIGLRAGSLLSRTVTGGLFGWACGLYVADAVQQLTRAWRAA